MDPGNTPHVENCCILTQDTQKCPNTPCKIGMAWRARAFRGRECYLATDPNSISISILSNPESQAEIILLPDLRPEQELGISRNSGNSIF